MSVVPLEASCALGVADAIVDLVESGETMKAAGLKAIETILETSGSFDFVKESKFPEMVNIIVQRLQGVLAAQEYVLCNYNAPKSIQAKCLTITQAEGPLLSLYFGQTQRRRRGLGCHLIHG